MSDESPAFPPADAESDDSTVPRGLVLVSTPIGNLGDMTRRAVAALRTADLVLCEDTRVTGRLLSALGIRARLQALHDHNEEGRIPAVLGLLRQGCRVVLVSDAGMPLVSDPGYRLVRAVIDAGLNVGGVPGPSAAPLALVLSGLPPQPFLFMGFPPPRPAARRVAFARLRQAERAGLSATLIWYEAPHRLSETLADALAVFGDRPAAVARELTKRFEEIRRGLLSVLVGRQDGDPARGEITLLLGPATEEPASADDLDRMLREALAAHSVKDAADLVAAAIGLPRKTVYARALALSRDKGPATRSRLSGGGGDFPA